MSRGRCAPHPYIAIRGSEWRHVLHKREAASVKLISSAILAFFAHPPSLSFNELNQLNASFHILARSYQRKHTSWFATIRRWFLRSARIDYKETNRLINQVKQRIIPLLANAASSSPTHSFTPLSSFNNRRIASLTLKDCHVFFSSAPFEKAHSGDTDYTQKMVSLLKEQHINASYITGSTLFQGQHLYHPETIASSIPGGRGTDDHSRKQAVDRVVNYIQSFDGPKIFHLQLRIPESGCLFSPEDLKKLRERQVRVIITCHEWQLNQERPHYQEQAFSYFQYADQVIFLNREDARHAHAFSQKKKSTFLTHDRYRIIPIPTTVSMNSPSVEEVVRRERNIIIFGLIRANKGFEQAVELARHIKQRQELNSCKVLIAGKPTSVDYFCSLAQSILALDLQEVDTLRRAWEEDPQHFSALKREIDRLQREQRPNALPAEFHLDLSEEALQQLISKCKYAYKPDNKGFANNASAIINLLAQGCVTFAKWGIVTDREFLPGGSYENALVLTSKQSKSLHEFYPSADEVIAKIVQRESDPQQTLNRQTIAAALKATHDPVEGVFSNEVIAQATIEAYRAILHPSDRMPLSGE